MNNENTVWYSNNLHTTNLISFFGLAQLSSSTITAHHEVVVDLNTIGKSYQLLTTSWTFPMEQSQGVQPIILPEWVCNNRHGYTVLDTQKTQEKKQGIKSSPLTFRVVQSGCQFTLLVAQLSLLVKKLKEFGVIPKQWFLSLLKRKSFWTRSIIVNSQLRPWWYISIQSSLLFPPTLDSWCYCTLSV